MRRLKEIKQMLYLNFVIAITSKISIYIITLLCFLFTNLLIFKEFKYIIPLLAVHFICYIFEFKKYQLSVLSLRNKIFNIKKNLTIC